MFDIQSIKKTLNPIAKKYGLKRVFLFGSYAKGNFTENSDVDLLVEKGSKSLSLLKISEFLQDIQEALQLSVDVVTTSAISLEFEKSIKNTQILIYEE